MTTLFLILLVALAATNCHGKSWTTGSGQCTHSKNFKTSFFFQDIKNFFHGVIEMGLELHQIFSQNFVLTNMVARGVQSFYILESGTNQLIEQWLNFFDQFCPDI